MPDEPANVEKSTTETVKLSGSAATSPPPPPSPAADDFSRKILAVVVVVQFVLVVGYVLYAGSQGQKVEYAQMVLGAEIGFMVTVLNYYYGSSSGSTAKDVSKKGGV